MRRGMTLPRGALEAQVMQGRTGGDVGFHHVIVPPAGIARLDHRQARARLQLHAMVQHRVGAAGIPDHQGSIDGAGHAQHHAAGGEGAVEHGERAADRPGARRLERSVDVARPMDVGHSGLTQRRDLQAVRYGAVPRHDVPGDCHDECPVEIGERRRIVVRPVDPRRGSHERRRIGEPPVLVAALRQADRPEPAQCVLARRAQPCARSRHRQRVDPVGRGLARTVRDHQAGSPTMPA